MKQYLYVFRGGRGTYQEQSPEEMQEHMERWGSWMQKISAVGHPLQEEGKVVEKAGEVITDGPFAEGKEIVGGYVAVPANDMDHAIEMSKGCPIFEYGGSVEVREIIEM